MELAARTERRWRAIGRRGRLVACGLCLVLGSAALLGYLLVGTWAGVTSVGPWLYRVRAPRLGSAVLSAIGRARGDTLLGRAALEERVCQNLRAASRGAYPADRAVEEIWQDYGRVAGWGDELSTAAYVAWAANCLRVSGEPGTALAIVDDGLSRLPPEPAMGKLVATRISVLHHGLGRDEQVIATFDELIVAYPERGSRMPVDLVLASYRRLQRGAEGVRRLRALAEAHPHTPLAASVRESLRKTVWMCSASGALATRGATLKEAKRAAEVAEWIPKGLRAVAGGDPAARRTAALLGFEAEEAEGGLRAVPPEAAGGAAAGPGRVREQAASAVEAWLRDGVVSHAVRAQAEACWEAVLRTARALPEGEAVLIVCDGRAVELALMAGAGEWSLAPVGGAELGACDLVLLQLDEAGLVMVEVVPINENARGRAISDLTTWRRCGRTDLPNCGEVHYRN